MSAQTLEQLPRESTDWGDLFADLCEKFVKNFSPEKVRKPIRELRAKYPAASPEVLARHLIRRASVKCCVAHTSAAALPVIGIPASLVADLSYVIDRQCYLVASIAYVYGHELQHDEAVKDTLYCIGLYSGAFAGEKVLSNVLKQGLKGEALRAFLQRLGIVLSQKALARVIPFVGPIVGTASTYTAVRSIGHIAIRLYAQRTPTTPPVPYLR